MTLVQLIQKAPVHYRLDGADTLRFEATWPGGGPLQAVEGLLERLNRKTEAA